MKKIIIIAFIIVIWCVLVSGCVVQKTASPVKPTSITSVQSKEVLNGTLNVSIGNYYGILPVFIDNTSFGEVSKDNPLNLTVNEGHHTVKVCDGFVCEQLDIEIKSAIKNSIDFGERLTLDIPKGSLNVSIGSFYGKLPVYFDNTSIGEVSTGQPLNMRVGEGQHIIKVCSDNLCKYQEVEIKSEKTTFVDFGESFVKDQKQGPLFVSIGGYNAGKLPVYIDNISVEEVSQGMPLKLMLIEGYHKVSVCVGLVCENESVDIKFAQPVFVDFGERLKKAIEFTKPTARIANFLVSDTVITMNIEFINPEKNDLTFTAIAGCGYSYIDWKNNQRKNGFAQTQVVQYVKAGERQTQPVTLYLGGGSHVIANEPTIVEVVTK